MSTIETIAVVWNSGPVSGKIDAVNGRISAARLAAGQGTASAEEFRAASQGPVRLELTVAEARVARGANSTLIQLRCGKSPVAFLLRDVKAAAPMYIPEYGVAITSASDPRGYAEIAESVRRQGLVSELQRIANDPEETYEKAAARNRSMQCPTWLGLGRDLRIFRVSNEEHGGYWGCIVPAFHSFQCTLPETDNQPYALNFAIGPGSACRLRVQRRLEDGVLPIVRSVQREGDVIYQVTAFATLETQPLSATAVRGSDWRAAYAHTLGNMYSAEEKAQLQDLIAKETHGREEELVCCVRVEAVNSGRVPRYAWMRAARISAGKAHKFENGCSTVGPERVYAVQRINGGPMPQEEMAVLLQPGECVVFDMLVPHQPISRERAGKLATLDFEAHLDACRKYWRERLAAGAQISVPEREIDERIRAGLLHLDINTLGQEPDGNVLTCVGWYSPIGSESAPMIQFYDSMGWHRLAERALDFFLERQREDGFIQNFGGYQLETGPVLWSAGEHFRYTRDEQWARRVKGKLLRSCEYLLQWRARNKKEELRGRGYGLLDGKVADPEDFFHSFMLNGLSYLGLQRVAEMLETIDPAESRRLAKEAAEYKQDIRQSYHEALARSPVIPLGDGTWAPAPPPWSEYRGPVSLYTEGGNWFTHGAFGARDSLIGPLYLVISEVLEPGELGTTFLLNTHQELMTVENAGLSQPYYCRHDFVHLKRGEVKAYLKTWYNQFTALQDRETYTFWEHYFRASQHKTHEEAWFLMQTRWMLFLEEGATLAFLRAIPRGWLKQGQRIELRNVGTYFGAASLRVESRLDEGVLEATVECRSDRRPKEVTIRLPHPDGATATSVEGGTYDAATETVRVSAFDGGANVLLRF
ncbi:MAG: hypothetical protein NTW87_26235 [Planctomycetota bacterium]|nr:hypothetical protein [Planctomycetota bacterium]